MKKSLLFVLFCSLALVVRAGVTYNSMTFTTASAEQSITADGLEMTVSGSSLIATNGSESLTLTLADLQKMYFSDGTSTGDDDDDDNTEVGDTTVVVTYNGSSATVVIADNITDYVTATVSGADVSIVQASTAGESTSGEITYILKGTSTEGSFYMEGSYKATISMQDLTLTNPSGPALNIQNGKRVKFSSKNGTANTLTDGSGGDWKGAIVCKGHSEYQGKGTLNVYGNTAHGIYSKEYLSQKNCTINVLSAVKDGVHCQQYFLMESGELNVKGFLKDGIEVDIKDTTTVDADDTGNFLQTGGDITIWMAGATGEGVKYEGEMNRTGGTLTIITETASENVTVDVLQPVEVYSLIGLYMGQFQTLKAADNRLQTGIYILRQGNKIQKVLIR